MAILTANNLGKYFGGQDIFANLSLSVHHGDRVALIGPNGTGKTTLLKLLAGYEIPTSGEIFKAKQSQIGYLEQHASLITTEGTLWELALTGFDTLRQQEVELQQLEAQLTEATNDPNYEQLLENYGEAQSQFEHAGGYQYEQVTRQVLAGLGFDESTYQTPVTQLSGGQQSRAQLAKLLLAKPDFLLLDEPTNHLDLGSVEWLETYLQEWPGALLVVSHDRYFLDKIATLVWEMNFGRIESYRGNFSHYVTQRAERLIRRQKEYETQQEFIKKEEDFIQRHLAGQRTKEAQGRRKRLERLERLEPPQFNKTLSINLQATLRSGDLVLATHDLVIGYPDYPPLFNCPDIDIRRGNQIALLGANGSGKTTFIKTILKQVEAQAGKIRLGAGVEVGYYAQTHASLDMSSTILNEVLSVKNLPIGEARNYLGQFLFAGDDVFKTIDSLSGGERSRVALAKLALSGSNFLILDEPTNHLDIPAQENLEQVLNAFQGTILVISHDRYFVDALADYTWAIESGSQSIEVTKGGYSAYLAAKEARTVDSRTRSSVPVQKAKLDRQNKKAQERIARQRARQVAELEQLISDTEAKLAQISTEVEVASQAQDVSRLQTLGRDYQTTETQLDDLLIQWTELAEEIN
ncbi:ABC-F family ATP-binding cassette domain-containing protein [Anaerolineales bacterium HSG6]|nr:ABC-F family ATP-binding cassette domain-containing protein [Anaerolineales bacterium HSG6]MDM8531532.1 ABC-F family ATP-binding cassette domain-containing protein [Anaerolineales bacterium HSG25]